MSNRDRRKKDEGIIEMLKSAGFTDVHMLRRAANALADPKEMADLMGLTLAELEALLNPTELSKLNGLGERYLGLLQAVGITSIAQLSVCEPFDLHARIEVAAKTYSVGRVPNRATVEDWIEQAQELNRK